MSSYSVISNFPIPLFSENFNTIEALREHGKPEQQDKEL
jgi:hypothetical protein